MFLLEYPLRDDIEGRLQGLLMRVAAAAGIVSLLAGHLFWSLGSGYGWRGTLLLTLLMPAAVALFLWLLLVQPLPDWLLSWR